MLRNTPSHSSPQSRILLALTYATSSAPPASTTLLSASELPRVAKTSTGSYRMMVDGQPYLILGAQTRNSSGWPDQLEKAWPLYKQLHANTAEIPV